MAVMKNRSNPFENKCLIFHDICRVKGAILNLYHLLPTLFGKFNSLLKHTGGVKVLQQCYSILINNLEVQRIIMSLYRPDDNMLC